VKVNNAKLLNFLEAVKKGLLGLITQLTVLNEAVSARLLAEAQHSPEIAFEVS
jgi:hypothetical protein